MISRQERLHEAFEYLRNNCGIHTQTDFANAIKYSRVYVSSALNGNKNNLTDKLLMAVSFFGFSTSAEWTTPLTVSARDADNDIIGLVNVAAAPFMANRATEFSGALFSTSGTFTITMNDEWDAPWTGTW